MTFTPSDRLKKRVFVGTLVATAFLAGAIASAVPFEGTLVFNDPLQQRGIIGYDSDTGILYGVDIDFDDVRGDGTPLHDGDPPLSCFSCLLNFAVDVNSIGGGEFEIDAGGTTNWVQFIGEIPLAGTGPNATLLTGSFAEGDTNRGGTFRFDSAGTDQKDPNLISYFYGAGNPPEFTFVLQGQAVPEDRQTGSLDIGGGVTLETWWELSNADLSNAPVPEPAATPLLLIGIAAIAAFRRRRP